MDETGTTAKERREWLVKGAPLYPNEPPTTAQRAFAEGKERGRAEVLAEVAKAIDYQQQIERRLEGKSTIVCDNPHGYASDVLESLRKNLGLVAPDEQ